MPIEIVVKKNINGHRILDYDIKENDHEKVIEVSDSKIFNQLSDLSKNAFTALGGKSLGRIDIKMDSRGVPHFIEANLMPGLRKGYFYRSCLLNLNMSYEQMILTVADNGLSSQRIHFPLIPLEEKIYTKPRTKIHKSFFIYYFKYLFINLINFLADCSAALSFRPTMAPHGNSHSFLYTSQFLSEEKSQPL